MPRHIKLEFVAGETPEEILDMAFGRVTIGRDTENSVVVDSTSVSRVHGSISEAGSQWVYRDHQSTNGSYLNGVRVPPGETRLMRLGDVVHIADFPIRVSPLLEGTVSHLELASILVFFGENFKFESEFSDAEPSFRVGGVSAPLNLDGEPVDIEQFKITKSETGVELEILASTVPVYVNGVSVAGQMGLSDGDLIKAGPYNLLVNDKSLKRARWEAVVEAPKAQQQKPSLPTFNPEVADVGVYSQATLPEARRTPSISKGWESEASKRRAQSGRSLLFDNDSSGTLSDSDTALNAPAVGGNFGGGAGIGGNTAYNLPGAKGRIEEEPGLGAGTGLILFFGIIVLLLLVFLLVALFVL